MTLVGAGARIGLGCMPMSFGYIDAASEDDHAAVIGRALDLGVVMFDTADVYGSFTNEQLVGRALEGRRRDATIATKWGLVAGPTEGIRSPAMPGPNGPPRPCARPSNGCGPT